MADYVLYWRRESAAEWEWGESIGHAGSNQFGKLEPGDTVWPISSDEDGLFLLGRIPVDEVVDREEAEEKFDDPWDADWHIVAMSDARIAQSRLDFEELVPRLSFDGKVKIVTGTPSHHHFRAMRKLSPASSSFLASKWDNHTNG